MVDAEDFADADFQTAAFEGMPFGFGTKSTGERYDVIVVPNQGAYAALKIDRVTGDVWYLDRDLTGTPVETRSTEQ